MKTSPKVFLGLEVLGVALSIAAPFAPGSPFLGSTPMDELIEPISATEDDDVCLMPAYLLEDSFVAISASGSASRDLLIRIPGYRFDQS